MCRGELCSSADYCCIPAGEHSSPLHVVIVRKIYPATLVMGAIFVDYKQWVQFFVLLKLKSLKH